MAACCAKFTLGLVFAILLILTIILFLGILGVCKYKTELVLLFDSLSLAAAGIVRAQLEDDGFDQEAPTDGRDNDYNDWFYYLIAATGLTLPFALVGTATVVVFIKVVKECRKKKYT